MVSVKKTLFTQVAIVSASITLAACATMPEASSPMALGVTAAAPTGYLDFCQRQPEDCGGAPAAVVRKVAEVELGRRNNSEIRLIRAGGRSTTTAALQGRNVNWGAAFAEARQRRDAAEQSNAAMAAALAETQKAETSPSSAMKILASAAGDAPRLQRLGEAAPAAKAESRTLQPAVAPIELPTLTPTLWGQITRINDKVNRQIIRRGDFETYGVLDRWATPLSSNNPYGDCEDYVLEKRRALIAAGLPESALSIAVANTSWGESHAVLLVATDQGDYVLDSLTPWVLPWRKASLTWRERQVAGAPFRWAMVSLESAGPAQADPLPATPVTEVASPPPPPRLLRAEAFAGRPAGASLPREADMEPAPLMTLALASGSPLRGLLH